MKRTAIAKRLFIIFLVAIIGVILLLCSCRTDTDATSNESEATVTFTDALGRTVTVQAHPERVAALIGSFAEVWQLAGGQLCAAADDAWDDFGLDMGEAVNIGGAHSPNAELLLASDPDLVLASASTAKNVEMKDILEAAGITVAYFDVDNFDDYLHMLDICSDMTERKDLYRQNGTDIQARIEAVRQAYAAAPMEDYERTVLLLRASSTAVKAKGSEGTVLGEMLYDMGCINIADNHTNLLENVSIEHILQAQPHHIFVVSMGSDSEAAFRSFETMMKENGAWATLDAVKENRLHYMDKTLFNLKPNARWDIAYETLYEMLIEQP